MVSSTPAATASGVLQNIGIECALSSQAKEFRARCETVDGTTAIVLFSRPLRNGLFQAFWDCLYIDAERALAKKAISELLTISADGVPAAQEFKQKFKDKKILEVAETGKILYAHHPWFLNAALESNKTEEQRKHLANSLTLAKSLEHNPGFRIWLQSHDDVERKLNYFFQFADQLLTEQNLPPRNTPWDPELLLEFAHEWKTSVAHDPNPDFHPYPTTAIVGALCELADLIIEKFGPRVVKPKTNPLPISIKEFQEKLGRDDRASSAMKGLYERMCADKPVFDETGMQLLGMLTTPEASTDSLAHCVKNFELFLKLFYACPHGLSQVDFDLLKEFARRWDHFNKEYHHLTAVVPIELRSALDVVLARLRAVCISS